MKHVELNRIKGFTLIELMIAVALAAIIITMAAPSFNSAMKKNKIVAETNELIADINFARSEAVKRSMPVVLCRSASPSNASPSCSGSASNWSSGWLVFADTDGDNSYAPADDVLIRIGNQELVYNPDGTTATGGNVAVFAICDDRGKDHGRQVQISATGRPRLVAPVTNSCASPSV